MLPICGPTFGRSFLGINQTLPYSSVSRLYRSESTKILYYLIYPPRDQSLPGSSSDMRYPDLSRQNPVPILIAYSTHVKQI